MYYLTVLYKAICYAGVLATSLYVTTIFRFRLFLNNVKFGKHVIAYNSIPKLVINRNASKVEIGYNVVFNSYTDCSWNSPCKIFVRRGGVFVMGDNSGMNGCLIYCAEKIIIKNNVKIGGGTRISDSNHHSLNYLERRTERNSEYTKTAPIIIEDDVFIGANCYIGKGVRIGARSIVAAGSVVVKDVPQDCVVGGNPCKIIKKMEYADKV